jgi:hypothetical protein
MGPSTGHPKGQQQQQQQRQDQGGIILLVVGLSGLVMQAHPRSSTSRVCLAGRAAMWQQQLLQPVRQWLQLISMCSNSSSRRHTSASSSKAPHSRVRRAANTSGPRHQPQQVARLLLAHQQQLTATQQVGLCHPHTWPWQVSTHQLKVLLLLLLLHQAQAQGHLLVPLPGPRVWCHTPPTWQQQQQQQVQHTGICPHTQASTPCSSLVTLRSSCTQGAQA